MSNAELVALIKKNPISFGCGLLSVVLAAGVYFRSGAIPETEAELALKSAEAERHASNIKNAAQLKEQVDALAAANKEIALRLVRASQLGVNNQHFYKLEAETGVKLVNFSQAQLSPAAKGAKTNFIPVGFSVSVQGSLAQLIDFLHRLESGARYCRILTARCGGSPGSRNGPITLTVTLELLGLP